MKQYRLRSDGEEYRLELRDVPKPTPGALEVVVRVRAVSLNYRDLVIRSGKARGTKQGVIPLSDGAGEVTATGSGVTRFSVGARVAACFFRDWIDGPFDLRYHDAALGGSVDGMLSEYVILPEASLVSLPDFLGFEEAACLPCAGVTAYHALFPRGGLTTGQTVLSLGTGGVSILGLQMAVAHGAKVIITSSSDEKRERAKELGARETVNYRATPDWDKEVWRITEKRGVDQVLEVGGMGTLEKSLNSVAASGHIALIGVLTGFGATPNLFPLTVRNARLSGIYVGSRQHFEELNNFLALHAIHPVIDRVFPFEQAPDAYAYLQSAAHFGKVIISV